MLAMLEHFIAGKKNKSNDDDAFYESQVSGLDLEIHLQF